MACLLTCLRLSFFPFDGTIFHFNEVNFICLSCIVSAFRILLNKPSVLRIVILEIKHAAESPKGTVKMKTARHHTQSF